METKSKIDPDELERVAASWIGTPFDAHGSMRGVGVDCVHLVAEIYIRLGVIESFNPPEYTMDGGNHAASSPIESYLAAMGGFTRLPTTTPTHELLPGDLITLRVGRLPWHCGLLIRNLRFIHSIKPRGVMESTLADPTYWSKLTGIYRPA